MIHPRPRRRVARALPALAALASLLGCARERPPRPERVLVAAIGSDPGSGSPALATSGDARAVRGLLYDGLVTLDEQQRPRPALAERWEVADGGTRHVFHLRRGVRWHDGRPFTAADVEFSIEQVLLRQDARARATLRPVLADVRALDAATVEFRFHRPYAALLPQLGGADAPMLPAHRFAGRDPRDSAAYHTPVGTGPFRHQASGAGSAVRYTANREYFGGAPWLDAIVFRAIADSGAQVLALEVGAVGYLFGVPSAERARLRRDPRIRLLSTSVNPGGSQCVATLGFNLDRAWFRDVQVRRAVAHAVNRRQYVDTVLSGVGRPADAPISSRLASAYAPGLPVPAWDTTRAAELLEAAGWRRAIGGPRTARGVAGVADGTPFVIALTVVPAQARAGELLRVQLRAVGIDVRIVAAAPAAFSQAVFGVRDFDAALDTYCQGPDADVGVRPMLASSRIGPEPGSNMAAYRNPAVDALLDRAAAAFDPDERRRLYARLQELVVRDQPYVWLAETEETRAHASGCTGLDPSLHFAATARCTP